MWIITIDDALETDMTFENIQIDEHNNAICTGLITPGNGGTGHVNLKMTIKKWLYMEEREE